MILLLPSPSKLCTAPRREDPTPLTASDMNMEDNKQDKTPPEHRTMGENGKKFLPEISLINLSSFEGKKLPRCPVLLQTQDYLPYLSLSWIVLRCSHTDALPRSHYRNEGLNSPAVGSINATLRQHISITVSAIAESYLTLGARACPYPEVSKSSNWSA